MKDLVGPCATGRRLFGLPDGWEILLGNGGTTVFWDIATFGLIRERSQHAVFGEFSAKFAEASAAAPHLGDRSRRSDPGDHPTLDAAAALDLVGLTHNETSTGVSMQLAGRRRCPRRRRHIGRRRPALAPERGRRVLLRPAEVLRQRRRAVVDGVLSAALERIRTIAGTRWVPASLDLKIALDNSLQNQTYNTPALATLVLLDEQLQWMLVQRRSGLVRQALGDVGRAPLRLGRRARLGDAVRRRPGQALGGRRHDRPRRRRCGADVTTCAALRANGIVDTDSYRKLGRNQLRIGMFPAIEPDDVAALTACIDHVVDALRS